MVDCKVSLADESCFVKFDPNLTNVRCIVLLINDLGFQSTEEGCSGDKTDKTVISIKGMTCQSCVKTIEGKISEHPAVKSIKVNLEAEIGTIEFDGNKTTPALLAEAIEDMGFEARVAGMS